MKILLIDDHKLFAMSIRMILLGDDDIEEVDIITSIESISNIYLDKYDIFLVDINLNNISDESGLELAEKIISDHNELKVVILTGHVKLMYEKKASKIGAKGFIDKNIEPDELIRILKEIYKGSKYFANIKDSEYYEQLTNQEVKILELIRKGQSIEKISENLYISRRTVFNHLNNIYSKLYVNNKQEAIYKSEQLGYFLDF